MKNTKKEPEIESEIQVHLLASLLFRVLTMKFKHRITKYMQVHEISLLVFSTFRSGMESDMVWERFLPFDYSGIVSRSLTPLNFSSKRQLFQCLCNPLLIDGGTLSFNLEKSSGKLKILSPVCKSTFNHLEQ
ncbi:hypothetical protein LWI29_022388 [Acer saccharum]|uniref:Uncharacterized protein n=1 Tax=Acer saccharum TaxID=4024 RepID=A0AA39W2A9_ACESA|nr:hypothetical protein LWI29_022388 [Acer saccharum]